MKIIDHIVCQTIDRAFDRVDGILKNHQRLFGLSEEVQKAVKHRILILFEKYPFIGDL